MDKVFQESPLHMPGDGGVASPNYKHQITLIDDVIRHLGMDEEDILLCQRLSLGSPPESDPSSLATITPSVHPMPSMDDGLPPLALGTTCYTNAFRQHSLALEDPSPCGSEISNYSQAFSITSTTTTPAGPTDLPTGITFYPYVSMPIPTRGSAPRAVKLFIGGLRYEMTKDDVSQFVSLLSGVPITRDNVVVFEKGPNQSSGSAVVHMPSAETAAKLLQYNKMVLCQDGGVCVATDVDIMSTYARQRRGPHPVVIEPARDRVARPQGGGGAYYRPSCAASFMSAGSPGLYPQHYTTQQRSNNGGSNHNNNNNNNSAVCLPPPPQYTPSGWPPLPSYEYGRYHHPPNPMYTPVPMQSSSPLHSF